MRYLSGLRPVGLYLHEIWGSRGGEDVDVGLLGCNAVWIWQHMNILPPSSGLAVCSSGMLVSSYKSTRRYNPEDQHQHVFLQFAKKWSCCFRIMDGNFIQSSTFNRYYVSWRYDSNTVFNPLLKHEVQIQDRRLYRLAEYRLPYIKQQLPRACPYDDSPRCITPSLTPGRSSSLRTWWKFDLNHQKLKRKALRTPVLRSSVSVQ
jgi:hypothetical protein